MGNKRTLYRIWYRSKGTKPLMPSCICAIGKRQLKNRVNGIQNDSRFEIVTVTEHVIK